MALNNVMNNQNNYLSELVAAGADAQSNLYDVEFLFNGDSPNGNLDSGTSTALTVRCDGFTPPEVDHRDYQVKFITQYIDRPSAKVDVDRTFSLTFRVDANYKVYKALLDQQGVTFNAKKGFVATDIKALQNNLFTVVVNAISQGISSENLTAKRLFKFEHCWITEIEPLKFDYSSSDPNEVRITCKYIEGHDLVSNPEGK